MASYTPRWYDPIVDNNGKMKPAFFKWLMDAVSSIDITETVVNVDDASIIPTSNTLNKLDKSIDDLKSYSNDNKVTSELNKIKRQINDLLTLVSTNNNAIIAKLIKRIEALENQ